jgi:hypothetical protein
MRWKGWISVRSAPLVSLVLGYVGEHSFAGLPSLHLADEA